MALTPRDRALALMTALALPQEEVERRLALAADPEYWRRLNPELSICTQPSPSVLERASLDEHTLSRAQGQLDHDGYLELPPFLADADVAGLALAVERVRSEGWPPAFVFVYDQAWDLVRTPSMQRLLGAALGPGYREDTLVWCFHVAPRPGASGWAPHSDRETPSNRLTLWFPLTDATLDNGCMYIVPQHALPAALAVRSRTTSAAWEDVSTMLRATRALPVAAGGVLGWRHHVLHWSAIAGQAQAPRISVAFEFLGADTDPEPFELPVIDGVGRPDAFALRLLSIGKSLREYLRFEPWLAPFADVARELEHRYRP